MIAETARRSRYGIPRGASECLLELTRMVRIFRTHLEVTSSSRRQAAYREGTGELLVVLDTAFLEVHRNTYLN